MDLGAPGERLYLCSEAHVVFGGGSRYRTRMELTDAAFLDVLRAYFRGERLEALIFIAPLGLASVAFAVALLRDERTGFTWGVAVPFLVLGLALVGVGLGVGLRTPGQVDALLQQHAAEPTAAIAQEAARMAAVNAWWPIYLRTWTAFAIVGLALRFGVSRDWALGLGTALLFFAGVGFMIDGFAERRARPYTEALAARDRTPR